MDYSNVYKRFASSLFAEGRNIKQVQEWLGHHKASFTIDTYIHLMGGGVGGPLPLPVGGQQGANRATETAVNGDLSEAAESGGLLG